MAKNRDERNIRSIFLIIILRHFCNIRTTAHKTASSHAPSRPTVPNNVSGAKGVYKTTELN